MKHIIRREFLAKVRNKTFLVMTILSPLLVVGVGLLVGYITKVNQESVKEIALFDPYSLFTENELLVINGYQFENVTTLGLDFAKQKTKEGQYAGLLELPNSKDAYKIANNTLLHVASTPGTGLLNDMELLLSSKSKELKLDELGIDRVKLEQAELNATLQTITFEGEISSKLLRGIKITTGLAGGYLIMMFVIIYGAMVMRSVIEEKTSRIIEVIISSVKPFELMMGKIIGTALAALLQFSIWGILLIIISVITNSIFGDFTPASFEAPTATMEVANDMPKSDLVLVYEGILQMPIASLFFAFLLFFILGYLLYSAIYAAIGAAVDNETDTQQFVFPLMIPLILGFYIGFAAVINEPHGTFATVFSIVPFTSPIVMLMRLPFGVPLWQIIVSLLFLIGTFIAIVWIGAKIYRIGILSYGNKPSYKDIYKWLKQSN
ncbi:ABC transporter permease [Urechidicola sp. KH5]